METLLWMIAGATLGWMSYTYLGLNETRGVLACIAIGAVCALIGAKVIAPLFVNPATLSAGFDAPLLFFAAGTAVCGLILGNFVYRRWGV